jgi:hypothetical protein
MARFKAVEGRMLVDGQDEQSGRNYLMLEGTDAKVYFIQYTPEMEQLAEIDFQRDRFRRGCDQNSFARQGFAAVRLTPAGENEPTKVRPWRLFWRGSKARQWSSANRE